MESGIYVDKHYLLEVWDVKPTSYLKLISYLMWL